jgi:hypothetical protein
MEEINISPNVIPILFGFILFNNVIGVNYFICSILLLNGIQLITKNFKFTDKIKNFIDDLELNENHGNFLWELLHLYSKASITLKQYILLPTKKYIVTPFSNIIEGSVLDVDRIVFVSNGNPVLKFKSKASMIDYLRKDRKRHVTTEYDFILFYPKNQNTMILDNINDIPDINHVDKKHINSNVGFMACQLIIHRSDGDIKKHLSLDEYMINGNEILSREFVLWYCKTFFKGEFLNIDELSNYTIHLLDNEVNDIKLTHNDTIKIYSDTYKIITYEYDSDNVKNNNEESNENDNCEKDNNEVNVNHAESKNSENVKCEEAIGTDEEQVETVSKNSSDEEKETIEIIDRSSCLNTNNTTDVMNSEEASETNVEKITFWDMARLNFKYFNGGINAISSDSNN